MSYWRISRINETITVPNQTDNKPLENEAVDFACARLAKAKFSFAKLNYDKSGMDIAVIEEEGQHHFKKVIIQSKGRNLSVNESAIKIPIRYVQGNFVCFVYCKIDWDEKDYFYWFFASDIRRWNKNEHEYSLRIPKNFFEREPFIDASYSAQKVNQLRDLLRTQPVVRDMVIYAGGDNAKSKWATMFFEKIYFRLFKEEYSYL